MVRPSGSGVGGIVFGAAVVDTSPTLAGGRALFGAHDGWVYCLSLSDGALVWRARAAPADDWWMAYGRLESRWPVIG